MMKMEALLNRLLIYISVLFCSTPLFATPPITAADTGAERLFFVQNVADQAAQRIVGSGVDLGQSVFSRAHKTADGSAIEWEPYRDFTTGTMRHVFYQQVL